MLNSFDNNTGDMVNKILKICGEGNILNIGCKNSDIVKIFCQKGIEAYGVDKDDIVIKKNNKEIPNHFFHSNISNLPFEDGFFDTVIIVDYIEEMEDVDKIIKELFRITKKNLYVQLSVKKKDDVQVYLTIEDKKIFENKFLNYGFRKHPMYLLIKGYAKYINDEYNFTALYEKINISNYNNLDKLKQHRNLHMDMTRETGVRSDGHIIRYVLATEFIQSGDIVLDCACGYGYGTNIIAQMTNASYCFGIDITKEAIKYAKNNFCNKNVEFKIGDAQNLKEFNNNSVDFITSFETLEHIPEPEKFLLEAYRILKPGGRIIVSVPNKWINEEGKDPSPYHLHTYDWEKLKKQISKNFYPEKAWELTMDGYFKNGKSFSSKRKLKEFLITDNPSEDTECILLLAMKDPLSNGYRDYKEMSWGDYGIDHHFVDFKNNYINPYIWKIVLSSPHRDVKTNIKFCQRILDTYPENSADYGGALCYLSYRLLELKDKWNIDVINEYINKIKEYINIESNNTHVYRWKISLTYVMAQLYLKIGNKDKAKVSLLHCIQFDPKVFSPTIATKLMLSYEQLCIIDKENKEKYWENALNVLKSLFKDINWTDVYGNKNIPVPFGFKEMAEIFMIVSRMAWRIYYDEKSYLIYLKTTSLEQKLLEKEEVRIRLEQMLKEAVLEKERKINEYENSLSWKITAPLRKIRNLFK